MRLATAKDEIAPLTDSGSRRNRAYLVIILLSRVITKLGTADRDHDGHGRRASTPADLSYLQDFYRRVNEDGTSLVKTAARTASRSSTSILAPCGGRRFSLYPPDALPRRRLHRYPFHGRRIEDLLHAPPRAHEWVEEISRSTRRSTSSREALRPRRHPASEGLNLDFR